MAGGMKYVYSLNSLICLICLSYDALKRAPTPGPATVNQNGAKTTTRVSFFYPVIPWESGQLGADGLQQIILSPSAIGFGVIRGSIAKGRKPFIIQPWFPA
jgi:hypothetical protein